MDWFRWHHGAVSDDKWPLIARKSGQPVAIVVAVWAALLECASQAEERGTIEGFDAESCDAFLQIEDGATQAVLSALSAGKKPRITGGRIVNWAKRQPLREREDRTSTERSRKYRERQKTLPDNDNCTWDASATSCNANGTPEQHQETPRLEKSREEERNTQEYSLRSYSSAELNKSASAVVTNDPILSVVISMPLNTGSDHTVTHAELEQWTDLYPAVDVMQELRNMRGWLIGNPKRRKTKTGINRFIQQWLAKAQNSSGSVRSGSRGFVQAERQRQGERALMAAIEDFGGQHGIIPHHRQAS